MQSWKRSGMVLCTYCQHYLVPRISDIPAECFRSVLDVDDIPDSDTVSKCRSSVEE